MFLEWLSQGGMKEEKRWLECWSNLALAPHFLGLYSNRKKENLILLHLSLDCRSLKVIMIHFIQSFHTQNIEDIGCFYYQESDSPSPEHVIQMKPLTPGSEADHRTKSITLTLGIGMGLEPNEPIRIDPDDSPWVTEKKHSPLSSRVGFRKM